MPRVNVYGPVSERRDGGIVPATILGLLPNGRVQLNQEVVGPFRAARGFSGGPAWLTDEFSHVAGMLVAVGRSEEARDVYLLGAERLAASGRRSCTQQPATTVFDVSSCKHSSTLQT